MRVVRDPSRIPDVVCMAVQLGIYATEYILDFYRPGEIVKFWEWHQREISEPDTWLSQQP